MLNPYNACILTLYFYLLTNANIIKNLQRTDWYCIRAHLLANRKYAYIFDFVFTCLRTLRSGKAKQF